MGGTATVRAALATAMVGAGLAVLPLSPADAVSTGRPVAVAVGADGTSYVGFATGGRLLRLTAAGAQDGSIPLDRADPVTALEVDAGGDVWVDYGNSVSELDPDGSLLTHFAHDPGGPCPADRAHDPASYGGLEVTASRVYVAGRCHATVGVYDLLGDRVATVDLPGTAYPRGIAWAPAFDSLPARLYVSVPDAGKVYAYDAAGLKAGSKPAKTIVVQQKFGFHRPEPGGLVADARGQVAVADVANNALYFYNGPQDYWFYRTLGHPPDAAATKGYLDRPSAIDQTGPALNRSIWVADTGNGRVQRWATDGTTEWMSDALPPGVPGAPVNTGLPEIAGRPAPGITLTCDPGAWDGEPTSFAFGWLRDGVVVAGATAPTYEVTDADVTHDLTCVVTATNTAGASAPAASAAFTIPGDNTVPYVVTRPVLSGTPQSGSVLTCDDGTWTDPHPTTYVRGWLRDGQLLSGTNTSSYELTRDDVSHQLSCRVAAVNVHGTGRPATSAAVTVSSGAGGHVDPPRNTRRPSILGTPAVGEELFCDPGDWDNAPILGYLWKRDGDGIGGAATDHYTVAADDRQHALTCAVTGTNSSGSDSAQSPAVTPSGPVDPDPGTGGSTKTCRGSGMVTIDGGARYAHDPYVVLKIRVPVGATGVTISNDAGFGRADTRALTASCLYKWTLPKASAPAPKVVRVRFPGAASSAAVTGRIVLDSSAPKLDRVSAQWSRARWAWVLTIRASDRGTGLARVQVGKSKGTARSVPWGRPVSSADSTQLRWVRVLDKAGNTSRWYHLTGF